MKKIYFGFIFLSLFAGACGSKKTAFTSEARIIDKTTEQLTTASHTDSTARNQSTQIEQTERKTEDYEQVIKIEFDTEKAVNNETNLPPVKSIEVRGKGQKTAEKTETATIRNDITNYDNYVIEDINRRLNFEKTEVVTEETEKKESQFLKWLAVIAVSLAVIFVCITIKKALQGTGIINWIKKLIK